MKMFVTSRLGLLFFLFLLPLYVAADSKALYEKSCFACHGTGVAGSPKLGDVAVWAPRIAQGMDVLVNNAINGYQGETGFMPAKGGNAALTDAEVSDIVAYMVKNSQ